MKTSKKSFYSIIIFSILAGLSLSLGACKKHKEIDLSSIHSSPASTQAQTMASTKESSSEVPKTTSAKSTEAAKTEKIESSAKKYTEGKLQLDYPQISGIEDSQKLSEINALIENNVKSVIPALGLDPQKDSMEIKSSVISADRKRLIIVYRGTYQKSGEKEKHNLFFTNNIDINAGKNLGLNDFTDPYTMAGYLLSDDVLLADANEELSKAFMEGRKQKTLEEYTKLLSNSDFPIKAENGGSFPSSFSYIKNGDIYFSIPLDHALGDYVIIKYSPSSK
ncbi:MAG: hypothetical protein Q4A19_01120 [Johnsonella sp.]|nr:hypothetical protein [Johnsonella sp.]